MELHTIIQQTSLTDGHLPYILHTNQITEQHTLPYHTYYTQTKSPNNTHSLTIHTTHKPNHRTTHTPLPYILHTNPSASYKLTGGLIMDYSTMDLELHTIIQQTSLTDGR
eukprot:TRINITY_DN7071_c0_g1_i3.p2 TRINITY_DN7071_c0_g1~~TRINITY_DN7071_c0_g1_i3.p2  ORF type:complete len:110 (+),score=7.44 TRINITY_DN7071_c0_g1_i3:130-459(+)